MIAQAIEATMLRLASWIGHLYGSIHRALNTPPDDPSFDKATSDHSRSFRERGRAARTVHIRETTLAALAFLLCVTAAASVSTWMHPRAVNAVPMPAPPTNAL